MENYFTRRFSSLKTVGINAIWNPTRERQKLTVSSLITERWRESSRGRLVAGHHFGAFNFGAAIIWVPDIWMSPFCY